MSPIPGNYVRSLLEGIRAGQFLSVGIAGAILDTVVLTVLVDAAGVPWFWGKVVSAEAAIVLMFLINDQWTFSGEAESSLGATLRRFARSNVVRAGGVAVAFVVLTILHGIFGVWVAVANLAGIGVGFVVNYVAESLFTWRVHVD